MVFYLRQFENICVFWFTFEYLIRLFTSSSLSKFIFDFLNTIDILCILPFYFGLFISDRNPFFVKFRYLLQMLRVMRLLKLGRYSEGIKSFTFAIKASSKSLIFLLCFLAFNVLVSSSIIYFAEYEYPNTKFTSILQSCW